MAATNPLWGAPRIHGELLKLGIEVAESTVSKYLPERERQQRGGGSGRWSAFLRNHAKSIVAVDFLVVPTATFRLLYVFLVLDRERRRIVHFTRPSTRTWSGPPSRSSKRFPGTRRPSDSLATATGIYGEVFRTRVKNMGTEELLTSYRSPWHNGYVERVLGSLRRELLDHVIVLSRAHLMSLAGEWVAYYHDDRTHLGLGKNTPNGREVEQPAPRGDASRDRDPTDCGSLQQSSSGAVAFGFSGCTPVEVVARLGRCRERLGDAHPRSNTDRETLRTRFSRGTGARGAPPVAPMPTSW